MADPKKPDKRTEPKRRTPASRPGGSSGTAKGRPGAARAVRRAGASEATADRAGKPAETAEESPVIEPIRESIAATAEQQSEQRLGSTARRAAILAAVVCVLTLTIAGPVRTYFGQRTEMAQLKATEAMLREQITDLEEQKAKLADPVFVAAQARERLGFVMPGDIPYQVQLPPGAATPNTPDAQAETIRSTDPWYTSLWHTIADTPHNITDAPVNLAPPGPEPTLVPTPGG